MRVDAVLAHLGVDLVGERPPECVELGGPEVDRAHDDPAAIVFGGDHLVGPADPLGVGVDAAHEIGVGGRPIGPAHHRAREREVRRDAEGLPHLGTRPHVGLQLGRQGGEAETKHG